MFEGAACWPVKTFGQAREFRNPDSHDAQKTCIVGMKASAAATNASTRTRCSISALAGLLQPVGGRKLPKKVWFPQKLPHYSVPQSETRESCPKLPQKRVR